jgi:lysophospholipase L1-like esterase
MGTVTLAGAASLQATAVHADSVAGASRTGTTPLVVFLGDSITEGFPLQLPDGGAGQHFVYPEIVSFLSSGAVRTINRGIGGDTTSDMHRRFEHDVLSYNPDYVNILGGINDFRNGSSPHTVVENISTMAQLAVRRSIAPILNTVTPPPAGGVDLHHYVQAINDGIRTFATRGSFPLIDLYSVLVDSGTDGIQERFDGVGVHPNQLGQLTMSQQWIRGMLGHIDDWKFDRDPRSNYVDDPLNLSSRHRKGLGDAWARGSQSHLQSVNLVTQPTTLGRWQQFTKSSQHGVHAVATLPLPRLTVKSAALIWSFAIDSDDDLAGNTIDLLLSFAHARGGHGITAHYSLARLIVPVSNMRVTYSLVTPPVYRSAQIKLAIYGGGQTTVRLSRMSLRRS